MDTVFKDIEDLLFLLKLKAIASVVIHTSHRIKSSAEHYFDRNEIVRYLL